ncbi:MAG: hypothetical protein ACFFCO_11935, partial [Promethearchaeota archaeon]
MSDGDIQYQTMRGWRYDKHNGRLYVMVDGVEAGYFTTSGWYVTVAGTGEVTFGSDATYPTTSDSNALGTTSYMWSDLFLASGGVINWNAGDVTLTHSPNTITVNTGTVLQFAATAAWLQIGTFTGSTSGTGIVVSGTQTAAFKCFTDDGNAAIGSGYLVRAGWFRNLQVYTSGNREQESCGVQGSLVSVAGTNR